MPGQTLTQIRALLGDAGLTPRHRFGQNFLIDLNLMRKLLAAADLRPADLVLEVGPGTGSLTEMLLETGAGVIAVEIDRDLASLLRSRLGDHPRFTLLEGDVLAGKHALNPQMLSALADKGPGEGGAYKLVANLPYQIATPLLMELLCGEPPFERMVCTIQKEVAQRLLAAPETSSYGLVSVALQTLARVRLVAAAPAAAFWPRPEVDSAIVEIAPLARKDIKVTPIAAFIEFVRSAFQQRRKMLRRIVRDWREADGLAALAAAGINPDARPEALTPADWQDFFRAARARPGP